MDSDHKRVGQVVSEIIRQAAKEHEMKKQQWFLEAKDKPNMAIKSSHIKETSNNVLNFSLDLL